MESQNFPRRASQRLGDPFLQSLLYFARGGTEFSLTLVVGGQVIHGTAISRERWFELWREELAAVGGDVVVSAFEGFDEDQLVIHEDELPDSDMPRRIYLMNARFGQIAGPSLARVQLGSVDAWSMGNSPHEHPPSPPTSGTAESSV